jgi:hypothetical protein
MKTYKDKDVEVRVIPHGQSLRYYCIEYREKKSFNWFNSWERYCYTWHLSIDSFDPHQPYLYEKYEYALEMAKMLKTNPELIDENNEKRWKEYNERCDRLREYREERNKSITL